MNLSPNFKLEEFLRSEYAARNDIDMTPPAAVVDNLKTLCTEVLEPIRAKAGVPLHITSGYRPVALNRAVGGSNRPPSDHIEGLAADVVPVGMSVMDLCEIVEGMALTFPGLKKCIYEFGQWMHVSVRSMGDGPALILTASRMKGQTVYSLGLRRDA